MKFTVFVAVALVVGALAGGAAGWYVVSRAQSQDELIADFYSAELAVHVSPHGMRKEIAAGQLSVTLVDLRSQEEYEREHIKGAVNIPAYRDPDHPAYYDVERIVSSFRMLPRDKDVVVYCYSTPCMTGRKIGKLLADNDIYVKHLGIGWNEWRYAWTSWNHEHEWNATNAEDYVVSGPMLG